VKLLAKTNRYYIFFSVITYLIIAGTFYLVVQYVIYRDIEKRLQVERKDFETYVAKTGSWDTSCYFIEDKIDLTQVRDTLKKLPLFEDTELPNRYTGEPVRYREIKFYTTLHNAFYLVRIRKSLIESDELLTFITATMLVFLSAALLLLFWFQKSISQTIWKPFYQTLAAVKTFDLKKDETLALNRSEIFEFRELNEVFLKMSDKMRRDYRNLKEFTENASHEIQTPLALINARVEELIQEEDLSKKQVYWIQEIHKSSIRLSKLNQALLLLSKIENEQFHETKIINLGNMVKSKIAEYDDIIEHRHLKIIIKEKQEYYISMNPDLADILISNLVGNAIKHNQPAGLIKISVYQNRLEILNTGKLLSTEPGELFNRFKKDKSSAGSLGLGLAIVREISAYYKLGITYQNKGKLHRFTLSQSNKKIPDETKILLSA